MTTDPLPHLETFARAAEHGSFTAAARALGLTQAAVSQRIQALERELGVSLFRRQPGRVLLTDAGQQLYSFARKIIALHAEARAAVAGQHAPVGGELSLGASSVPGEHLLPALLPAFRQRYPNIQVRATIADSAAVQDLVERGKVHLGFVGRKADSPHLEYHHFTCDQMVLVIPAGHPWARRRKVRVTELAGEPLVVREAGSGSRWCLEQALAGVGKSLRDLQVALELGSNESIKEAVRRGLGLAVLSGRVVEKEVSAGQLRALAVIDLPLKRKIYVVWDRRRVLPTPARLFLDFLEANPPPQQGA